MIKEDGVVITVYLDLAIPFHKNLQPWNQCTEHFKPRVRCPAWKTKNSS